MIGTHMSKTDLPRESHASAPNMGFSLTAQSVSTILWHMQMVYAIIFLHYTVLAKQMWSKVVWLKPWLAKSLTTFFGQRSCIYMSLVGLTCRLLWWDLWLCSSVWSTRRVVREFCTWLCQWLRWRRTRLQEQLLGPGDRLWVLHSYLQLWSDSWTAGGDCFDSDSGSQPCPRSGEH